MEGVQALGLSSAASPGALAGSWFIGTTIGTQTGTHELSIRAVVSLCPCCHDKMWLDLQVFCILESDMLPLCQEVMNVLYARFTWMIWTIDDDRFRWEKLIDRVSRRQLKTKIS